MASSLKTISSLLVFALFFLQIHGREGQFFSKFPNNNNVNQQEGTLTNTQDQNPAFTPETTQENRKTSLPNREEQAFGAQEQDPSFMPETENSYGLYGHESREFPPTTTTNANNKVSYAPYTTSSRTQSRENYNTYPNSNQNSNDNYYNYNKYAHENQAQNLGNTRFAEKSYSTNMATNDNYYNNGGNGYSSFERQGMSDTRFLENGKYFYDPGNENNYHPNSRGAVGSRNEYNTAGYYGNNNVNSYNSMEGFQNQEEFPENEEEFEP